VSDELGGSLEDPVACRGRRLHLDRAQQRVARAEVPVERRARDAGLIRDPRDRRGWILPEQRAGGSHDLAVDGRIGLQHRGSETR
jgi:hypothetical protein